MRTGSRKENVLSLAQRVINAFEGLPGVARASIAELCTVDGIGLAKASQIQAALELGKRLVATDTDARARISSPADAANIFAGRMAGLSQEEMHVLLLDTRNRVQRAVVVYRGNVNASMIRMSELFADAVRDNAPSIILAHNHPSGDTSPSADDIQVTRDAVKAGALLDIQVLDHLIIGGTQSYLSMKDVAWALVVRAPFGDIREPLPVKLIVAMLSAAPRPLSTHRGSRTPAHWTILVRITLYSPTTKGPNGAAILRRFVSASNYRSGGPRPSRWDKWVEMPQDGGRSTRSRLCLRRKLVLVTTKDQAHRSIRTGHLC